MGDFRFHLGLQAVWEFVGEANRYIVRNEPWVLAKNDAMQGRLDTVMYSLAESLRLLALVLRPVMPETAATMQYGLGIDEAAPMMQTLEQGAGWGLTLPGTRLNKIAPLFPRAEKKQRAAEPQPGVKTKKQDKKKPADGGGSVPPEGVITFEQFKDVELRVARVTAAERVAKSERLLKLTVQVPEERTIVAGIAGSYAPEDVVGLRVVVVANLKPAKLMGIRSQGMVLAAKTKDEKGAERFVLSTVAGDVEPGSRVA
jgi:methionyl-tRNA synthetase